MLQTAGLWARREFDDVDLGDRRLSERAVKIAEALAERPGGTLPGPLSDWADLKAAYRFVGNEAVTFEKLQQPHRERTHQSCCSRGEYLLIEDTTQADFTLHWSVRDLGRIGDNNGRGFYIHTTLAMRIEHWTSDQVPVTNLIGLLDQKVWTRDDVPKKGRESKSERLRRPRESQRWLSVLDRTGSPPPGSRWTFVGDREADIAEVILKARENAADVIIRAARPRALVCEEGNIFQAAAQAPIKGTYKVKLRARAGRSAREATLQVRAREVTLKGPWRPGGNLPPMTINVLEVREIDAPANTDPLLWVLLTSWPCQTLEQCVRIVEAYGSRWLVEEYHKALKSGVGLEESQLESAHALQSLLGILALIAARLLAIKLAARIDPHAAAERDTLSPEMWAVLEAKFGRPKDGWQRRNACVAIARLGGFLARKGDGDPGWLTLWRGWQRLVPLSEGYALKARCVQ